MVLEWLSSGSTIYFRGTSLGYPGSPALQKIEVTPTTTDPVVATIFATESASYGKGVVYLAAPANLAGANIMKGNVLRDLEAEVAVGVSPTEFARRAGATISAAKARDILGSMGIKLPPVIRGPAALDAALRTAPRLTQHQIQEFIQKA